MRTWCVSGSNQRIAVAIDHNSVFSDHKPVSGRAAHTPVERTAIFHGIATPVCDTRTNTCRIQISVERILFLFKRIYTAVVRFSIRKDLFHNVAAHPIAVEFVSTIMLPHFVKTICTDPDSVFFTGDLGGVLKCSRLALTWLKWTNTIVRTTVVMVIDVEVCCARSCFTGICVPDVFNRVLDNISLVGRVVPVLLLPWNYEVRRSPWINAPVWYDTTGIRVLMGGAAGVVITNCPGALTVVYIDSTIVADRVPCEDGLWCAWTEIEAMTAISCCGVVFKGVVIPCNNDAITSVVVDFVVTKITIITTDVNPC